MCQSTGPWVCCVCLHVCLCVCVISNQTTSKKLHVSDLSKLDALLHKTRIKVLRLDMCTSISLSKIAHQMCCDHPFSQRNKITELAVGVEVGGHMEGEGVKFEKGGWSILNYGCFPRNFLKFAEELFCYLWTAGFAIILYFRYLYILLINFYLEQEIWRLLAISCYWVLEYVIVYWFYFILCTDLK